MQLLRHLFDIQTLYSTSSLAYFWQWSAVSCNTAPCCMSSTRTIHPTPFRKSLRLSKVLSIKSAGFPNMPTLSCGNTLVVFEFVFLLSHVRLRRLVLFWFITYECIWGKKNEVKWKAVLRKDRTLGQTVRLRLTDKRRETVWPFFFAWQLLLLCSLLLFFF